MSAAGATLPAPRQRCRVLVVDDEHDLADLAQDLLLHSGFDVSVAYGAPEALQMLGSGRVFDAVFSDIMMPGMDGIALAEMINVLHPRIRVVLTSGYAGPSRMPHSHHPFIPKPYRIAQVIALLVS